MHTSSHEIIRVPTDFRGKIHSFITDEKFVAPEAKVAGRPEFQAFGNVLGIYKAGNVQDNVNAEQPEGGTQDSDSA